MLYSILGSIIFIFLFILAVDVALQFNTWQCRIKIGKYQNQTDWKIAVENKSRQWLKKSPTIKLTDNDRLVIIDMLRGNYQRDAIQYWQEAALILGLTANDRFNPDPEIRKEIDRYVNTKVDTHGQWLKSKTECDAVILGYALIQLEWVNHNWLRPAYDALWQMLQTLTGEDGTVSYKTHTHNYRFVDTIGFICPFLVNYGQRFNVPEAVDLAIRQIEAYNKYGMLKDEFIPCHTYVLDSKLPAGLFGWGRGLGWYAIGLIDAWTSLDNNHTKKTEMDQWVLDFAKVCMRFQRDNGAWGWLIMQKDSQAESSATATLGWFLKKAATIQEITVEASQASELALNYLMKVTRRCGAVDFAQGDTKGIAIYSTNFDILPFAQGFCLRILKD